MMKGENLQITLPSKDLIHIQERNQFEEEQKLREFITTKTALQQMLKDFL